MLMCFLILPFILFISSINLLKRMLKKSALSSLYRKCEILYVFANHQKCRSNKNPNKKKLNEKKKKLNNKQNV